MCLTLGIAMGSWWAYYELGWGGWWFWDPVENASFMPWLAGTALLHSALVMEKRDALKVWTVLLAILTFSLSLMGTFLVRSGVLTSVHAFAVDPQRGVFILAIMTLFTGGGLALFALRARDLRQGGIFAPISREGSLVLNNILLTTACATVFVGTLYPLLLESLTGDKISVGPPYFDWTFGPLMVPLLLALPFGPFLAWKRGDVAGRGAAADVRRHAGRRRHGAGHVAFHRGPWLAPFGLALGVFVMAGAVSELAWRIRLGSVPLGEAWRRFANLPRSAIGTALAHFGVGMLVVGVVATSAYREERILIMKPGEQVALAGYDLTFRGVAPGTGPNYREEVAVFDVTRGGAAVTRLEPARAHLRHAARADDRGRHSRRMAWRSLRRAGRQAERRRLCGARLLQSAGALHLARRGGHVPRPAAVSLSDRRLRVGAPGRRAPRRRGARRMTSLRDISRRSLRLVIRAAARRWRSSRTRSCPTPQLEARAREISAGLRCLVCQNQSIDDSNAPLARDLRLLVRERLKAGDSDAQVMRFVEDRYGEFVLLRPPLSWRTIVLWVAPMLALLVAVWMTARAWRRRQPLAADAAVAPLSPDEEEQLRSILAENEGEPPVRD